MSSVIAGAAVAAVGKKGFELGMDALSKILTIASTPEGMAWVGRMLADKQFALDAKVASMKEAPDPKVAP